MTPHAWRYENDMYRGFVRVYHGQFFEERHCAMVRNTRLKSLNDAKRLISKIRRETKLSLAKKREVV
jgi:hypothetical protein